jgi:hypothetical protein
MAAIMPRERAEDYPHGSECGVSLVEIVLSVFV